MNAAPIDSNLPWLQRVAGVHSESIALREPFLELVRRFAHLPGTVALVSGGTLDCARHDILGVYPWLSLSGQRTQTTLTTDDHRVELDGDPFTNLRRVLQRCSLPDSGLPLPFCSGLLGYLAYKQVAEVRR